MAPSPQQDSAPAGLRARLALHGVGWRWRSSHAAAWQIILVGITILVLGLWVARYKHQGTRHVEFTGHADASGYVHMARSLAQGRGLTVPYVSWHFIPYDPAIARREDHWPPFLALCMAPLVRLIGDAPWVYRLAPIAIGSIGLPLAVAALAGALSRRGYVALWAGLLAMVHPLVFNLSTQILSDVATAMLVAAYAAAVLAGARRDDRFALAGLLAGLAFLAKGSQLLLLPLLPVLAVIVAGWRALWRRGVWLGLLAGGLVAGWYLAGTARAYGDPLHNTQRYAAGYVGLLDWEEGTYRAYWGRDLPGVRDRWTLHADRYARAVRRYREEVVRWAVLGPRATAADWDLWGATGASARRWLSGRPDKRPPNMDSAPVPRLSLRDCRDPAPALTGTLGLGLAAVVFACGLLARPGRALARRWAPIERRRRVPAWPPLARPLLALALIAAAQGVVLVYLWQAMARLALVFLPLNLALGCTAVSRLIEWPWRLACPRLLARRHGWATVLLALLCGVGAWRCRDHLPVWHAAVANRDDWLETEPNRQVALGKWFAARAPNAVIMTRYPWQMLYHAAPGNRAVTPPLGSAETLFAVARHYRVTHLVNDVRRPALVPYLEGARPGLRRIADTPVEIYELDYAQLPGLNGLSE